MSTIFPIGSAGSSPGVPDVFDGIKPYVARSADRARLLVGPFRGASDAAIFAQDLETLGVDAFKFTNSPADRIAPLPAE